MAHSVMACHLYVICSIEPSVGSRRTRWSNRRTTGLPVPMRADVKQPSAQILLQYCTSILHTTCGYISAGQLPSAIPRWPTWRTPALFPTLSPIPVPYAYPLLPSPTPVPYPRPLRLSPAPVPYPYGCDGATGEDTRIRASMRADAEQRFSARIALYLSGSPAAHTLPQATPHRAVASEIDIGSSAKTKPFIDALRPDPTPIERSVDRSPTRFAEEGPCREDRSHPRKAQRRRKRKQDGRGVPFNSNIQEAHGSRNNSCPKTPTQSPEKEKEKETGSRCISFNSNVRGRVALTVAAPPNGYQRTRSSLTVIPLDEITTLHRTLRHLLKRHGF
ncbi:hypothetical protein BU17DRAFT_64186 [Hysterangium stoloniferum]|nr:hypothetical protein BU17DRAFT_64186 [Hysterangium stoloniferum]